MELFTKCNNCCFYKSDRCGLDLWDTSGFANCVSELNGDTILKGRICPYHRVDQWAALKADPLTEVKKEVYLRYAAVLVIDKDYSRDEALEDIIRLRDSALPPSKFYLVDRSEDNSNHQNLVEILKTYDIEFRTKQVIDYNLSGEEYIDEYVMTQKLTEAFYIAMHKPNISLGFIQNLNKLIYHDMSQVLYAGNNDYYFMLTSMHKIVRNGFKEYLINLGHQDKVISYEEIC